MATIFGAAWDYLRGNDLKVSQPSQPGQPGPVTEQKTTYWNPIWTTDTYDGSDPALSMALGGPLVDLNSAVFACLKVLAYSYQEAPLRQYVMQPDGTDEYQDDTPFMALLADPHPSLSSAELAYWLQWAKHLSGNAYLRKIRTRGGAVVQLWPYASRNMWPYTTPEDRARGIFISYYVWDDGFGNREELPVEDVVHFRLGVDEYDHRLGLSPIRRLIRECSSDEQATLFTDALLRNTAVGSLVVTTPDRTLTAEQAQQLKDNLAARFGGGNRGAVGVLNNGATVTQLGFSPEQLDLKAAHQTPEARIAAVMGVSPMLVGLQVGLEHSIYNNYKQAQEQLFEQTIVPTWRADQRTWEKQLLRPDFETNPKVHVRYDTTEVRALQEDVTAVYTRVSLAVEKGWMTKDEARAEVGLDPLPDGLGEAKPPAPPPSFLANPDQQQQHQGAAADGGPPSAAAAGHGQAKQLVAKQLPASAFAAVPGLMDTLEALAQPALQADVQAYLAGQHARIVAALSEQGG